MSDAQSNRILRAGPLTMLLADGEPRYLRASGIELLRRIHTTLRDHSWGTVEGRITSLQSSESSSGFEIHCTREHRTSEIDFVWRTTIKAREIDGGAELHFTAEGEARSTFRTNRTGICLLHPLRECAGRSCEVEHLDGRVEQGHFPALISPHQPFTNIRAITHEPSPGLRVDTRFEGDVFEMEDHRNWTDASFKTYCRPLRQPFPYLIERGQRIVQRVSVRVMLPPAMQPSHPGNLIELQLGKTLGRLPSIGLCANSLPPATGALRLLNPAHLRVDLTVGENDLAERLARCAALGIPLEVALHLDEIDDQRIEQVIEQLSHSRTAVARCIVHHVAKPFPSPQAVAAVKLTLSKRLPNSLVGGGTIGNFAEVNRARSVASAMDLLAYPANPLMHASDDLTLIENIEAQGDTVRTARHFAPHAHIAVTPVTMHRRGDPFAAGKVGQSDQAEVDEPRLRSPLGALWTLGSLKHLAEAGADSITYFDIAGPLGVLGAAGTSPLFDLFHAIGQFTGADVIACRSSMPLTVDALALSHSGRIQLLLANFSHLQQRVSINTAADLLLEPQEIRIIELPPEVHQ